MRVRRRKVLLVLIAALVFGATTVAYAAYVSPADFACVYADFAGLESLPDGALVEPGMSRSERAGLPELQSQARARIESTFGTPRSHPTVVFFRDSRAFWPLLVNPYGSAGSIGEGSCVLIGPKGRSVDVVAHELMHQELLERVGYWRLITEIPVWFNEGVAMQVDFRPQYALAQSAGSAIDTGSVRALDSIGEFNDGDDEQLTQHYAFAKAEVARWLDEIGRDGLYLRLERIRAGESFAAAVAN